MRSELAAPAVGSGDVLEHTEDEGFDEPKTDSDQYIESSEADEAVFQLTRQFDRIGRALDAGWFTGYDEVEKEFAVPPPAGVRAKGANIGAADVVIRDPVYEGSTNMGWKPAPKNKIPAAYTQDRAEEQQKEGLGHFSWDILKVFRDVFINQHITDVDDGAGNQGRQAGGVTVDWRERLKEGGAAISHQRPHFAHLDNGRVEMQVEPLGSVLPYRAEVQSTVFRPCKLHSHMGCPLEPPMPDPPAPPPPLNPRVQDFPVSGEDAVMVDEEAHRYNKKLFDLAARLNLKAGPMDADDVHALLGEARLWQRTGDVRRCAVNVFRYVLANYEMTDEAHALVAQVVESNPHHQHLNPHAPLIIETPAPATEPPAPVTTPPPAPAAPATVAPAAPAAVAPAAPAPAAPAAAAPAALPPAK
jgi:hypothetical protein